MNAASDDLAGVLPPVKPWEQRRKAMWPLAGGAEQYLSTLEWILRQCQASDRQLASIAAQYGLHFGINESVGTKQVEMLRGFGLLDVDSDRCVPSSSAVRWLETGRSEIVIGAIHANMRLVGELLDVMRLPRSREHLRHVANDDFGLGWKTLSQVAYRLNWLRSAGLTKKLPRNEYQATEAGLAFLGLVDLHPPSTHSTTDEPRQPVPDDEPLPPTLGPPKRAQIDTTPPSTSVPSSATADEIAQRLVKLSCDGAKHKEFEVAVRDAFDLLGLEAEQLSGAGQTDVLISGVRSNFASGQTAASAQWRNHAHVSLSNRSQGSSASRLEPVLVQSDVPTQPRRRRFLCGQRRTCQ